MVLYALIRKELLLLLRDWHALALLFLMPAGFILVMSLALQDRFAADQGVSIRYYLVDEDRSDASRALATQLEASKELQLRQDSDATDVLRAKVRADQAQFLVVIPKGFAATLDGASPQAVQVQAGPGVEPAVSELFAARVHGLLAELYLERRLGALGASLPDPSGAEHLLHMESLYTGGARPSSVQQNVPAWLLFAMFFIAIPLSTTWVQERSQGTYARLRSMGLGARVLLLGKLIPYLGITLVQATLMLAVGVWVVPALGGGQLSLGHAPLALLLITLAAGFAAVCYALLVANLVSTAEQATIFTGVANLLMAAVGGIMVPRFVMPAAMQAISLHSPMAWGLEGFLEVFLRQGGVVAVAPWVLRLTVFGLACLAAAALSMRLRHRSR
ncbi:MAG TPA: ABC transporter permease [Gammaproteobacteria bacterium]